MTTLEALYGSIAFLALFCTVWSWKAPLIWCGAVMVVSWRLSNLIVHNLGFHAYPLIIPEIDAALGIILAYVTLEARSLAAVAVVALFALEMFTHVGFLSAGLGVTKVYIVCLNAIFSLQCLIVGIAGVKARDTGSPSRRYDRALAFGRSARRNHQGMAKKPEA